MSYWIVVRLLVAAYGRILHGSLAHIHRSRGRVHTPHSPIILVLQVHVIHTDRGIAHTVTAAIEA